MIRNLHTNSLNTQYTSNEILPGSVKCKSYLPCLSNDGVLPRPAADPVPGAPHVGALQPQRHRRREGLQDEARQVRVIGGQLVT